MDNTFPEVTDQLIEALNQLYPNKSPTLSETQEQLKWRGGQRNVVEFLIGMNRYQNTPQTD